MLFYVEGSATSRLPILLVWMASLFAIRRSAGKHRDCRSYISRCGQQCSGSGQGIDIAFPYIAIFSSAMACAI